MSKFGYVVLESVGSGIGFFIGITSLLSQGSPAITAAGFSWGITLSLIVIGMSAWKA